MDHHFVDEMAAPEEREPLFGGASAGAGKLPGGGAAERDDDPLKLAELSEGIDTFIGVLLRVSQGTLVPTLQNQITLIRKYQSQMLAWHACERRERQAEAAPPPAVPPPAAPPPAAPPSPVDLSEPRAAAHSPEPLDWDQLARQLLDEVKLNAAVIESGVEI
jgi:hypothetical protein